MPERRERWLTLPWVLSCAIEALLIEPLRRRRGETTYTRWPG